jgi:hypothetical protein
MESSQEKRPILVSRSGVEIWKGIDAVGAAGAGSLVLEFTVLSRLTGDQRFEVNTVSISVTYELY